MKYLFTLIFVIFSLSAGAEPVHEFKEGWGTNHFMESIPLCVEFRLKSLVGHIEKEGVKRGKTIEEIENLKIEIILYYGPVFWVGCACVETSFATKMTKDEMGNKKFDVTKQLDTPVCKKAEKDTSETVSKIDYYWENMP